MQVVSYDPQRRSLKVRLGDKSVLIEGLAEEPAFRRFGRGGPDQQALWLDPSQADVLVKMIEYILAKVRISEASQRTLEELLPAVRACLQPPAEPPTESS